MVQKNNIKQKILLIAGPTAVGKSSFAVNLAKKLNAEIISADSVQVYKHMNIGSAKISNEEKKDVVHHLIDIKNPNEEYSVAEFKQMATDLIVDISKRNKLPIIVGGTGLYLKALLFPFNFGNTIKNDSYRQELQNLANNKGAKYVHDMLKKIDPISANEIEVNNVRRVIRALEIFNESGKTKSSEKASYQSPYDYKLIVLNNNRDDMYNAINNRVLNMFDNGLIDEVKLLINNHNVTFNNQSMQAIGYKEFFDYFNQQIDKNTLIDNIQKNTRHFAKRQITWFKTMPNADWVEIKHLDKKEKELLALYKEYLV